MSNEAVGSMEVVSEDAAAAAASQVKDTAASSSSATAASNTNRIYSKFKTHLYAEMGAKSLQNENHSKRMQNLRKELTHIKETDWKYEPIDKFIGGQT